MPLAVQTEPVTTHCGNCGGEIPPEADHCPSCGLLVSARSTRITLAITLVIIFAGFALTQWYVNLHRVTELSLARRWFTRGNEAMQANAPKFAAEAFRTALNYDRENEQYRLHLAQALLAENRLAEARAHLVSLWEEEPANGGVNLTLARLEAALSKLTPPYGVSPEAPRWKAYKVFSFQPPLHGDNSRREHFAEAVRYYNDAINGVWLDDPLEHRIATRFELARYFIQQQQAARAQAELLALLADAPSNPADQLRLGQMLLEVGDPAHALQAYNALLSKDPNNAQAWLGAGQAYLALGNYAEAERATANAIRHDPNLEGERVQLELTRELLRIAPSLRGLSHAERAERVALAFDAALKRLSSCAAQKQIDLTAPNPLTPGVAPNAATNSAGIYGTVSAPNPLQLLYTSGIEKQPGATVKALRANPDALEPTMQWVFEVERATAPLCPATDITDRALLTLAQREGEIAR